jgi:hypothetical protein
MMKHLKMLGLAVMAAAALMAIVGAGTASATILTSPAGTKYTGEIDASLEPGTTATLQAGIATVTCSESTVKGKPYTTGSATTTPNGPITSLTFTSCGNNDVTPTSKTSNFDTDGGTIDPVVNFGKLEIHVIGSGPNGTLTSEGSEVDINFTAFGVTCVYGTPSVKDIGTLTGSSSTGGTATMDINAEITKISGGFACANPAKWEAKYIVTTPDNLNVS